MMTLLSYFIFTLSSVILSMMNPMKLCYSMVWVAGLMFLTASTMTGSVWWPTVLFMLFVGGILIILMIISSLMKNSSTKKLEMSWEMMLMATMICSTMTFQSSEQKSSFILLKWILSSNLTMAFLMIMASLYFFSFMKMISEEKTTMRVLQECFNMVIL